MVDALQARYQEFISDCKIGDIGPGNRGVFATKDLERNSLLLKLPMEHCYQGNHLDLTYRIMSLDNDYTRALPASLTDFPVFWTPGEVASLESGSALAPMIASRREKLLSEDTKKKALFLYYRTLVGSRAFTIDRGNKDKLALVPFADMLNHSNHGVNVDWKVCDDHFVLKTTTEVKAGEQLFDSYGTKTNYENILFYGFTLPSSENLMNDVTYEIFDVPAQLKKNLNYQYFSDSIEFELCGSYSRGTLEIFSLVRFLTCANADESECPQTLNGFSCSVISRANEATVCKVLSAAFKTIYTRKVKVLRFVKAKKVCDFVDSEVNVLLHWIKLLDNAVKILSAKKQKDAKKLIDKYDANDYYNQVVRKLVNQSRQYN